MRKNIRRSLIVAAAASGIWALGTSGANAAELPVSTGTVTGTVEKVHKGGLTDTIDEAKDTVRKTTEGVTRGVTEKLPSKGIPENGLPTNTLPLDGLPTDRVDGAVEGAGSEVGKVTDGTDRVGQAVKDAQDKVGSAGRDLPAVPGVEVPQLPPRTLPTVALPAVPEVPQVPTVPSAPATGDLVNGLAAAGLRPEKLVCVLKGDHAQQVVGTVRKAVSTAQPLIDRATGTVVPPFAGEIVVQVEVVADQAATDTAVTVDDAAATSAPVVESTAVRTHALAENVTGELRHFGDGVGEDAVPYAHDLGAGLHRNVNGLAIHVISGVQVITVPSTGDLTDAANIPGLPAVPQLPAVPAV